MKHAADVQLVRDALARQPEALRHVALRSACVSPFLRRRAAHLGMRLSSGALDDAVQETFLAIWRKLATYRGEARLETWACGFALVQLRRLREAFQRNPHLQGLDGDLDAPEVEYDDSYAVVDQALEQLGSPVEEVIRLKHFEELTFDEIAERWDMPSNTAKSHYYRGLSRLRVLLGSRAEELAG